MRCLDDDTVLGLADGRWSAASADPERIAEHIDVCSDCRTLLADVARLGRAPGDGGAEAVRVGTAIDHFVVRRWIGSGTSAAVYAADDLQLRRAVALKLFHREKGTSVAAKLARAEAEALARSHHPNVLTVHAVGTYDGRPYLVTALVEGMSLRDWVARHQPSWRLLLRTLLAAGEGLAAAHGAGVVHRDFKPDHVIVGADQRPVVVDFGFARLGEQDPSEVAGTPAYMAPEQRAGISDARSDQFAFARVAWEALSGAFGTRLRRVPRAVRGPLRRALAEQPTARFPDLRALLAALARGERRRRLVAVAGIAVVGIASASGLGYAVADPRPDVCATSVTPAAVWSAAVERGAPGALWWSDSPGNTASARRSHAAAERWVAQWSAAATRVCEPGPGDRAAAASCLDVARTQFARLLESPAAGAPADFLAALGTLDRPSACTNAAVIADNWPSEAQDHMLALQHQLGEVEMLAADGDREAAIALAEPAVRRARELAFIPLVVRAELAWGTLLSERGEGVAVLEGALRTATELNLDQLRARALLALAIAAFNRGEPELAAAHAREGEAIVERIGDSAAELRVDLHNIRGMLAYADGAYDEALAHAYAAIAIGEDTVDRRLPKARFNAGSILQSLGRAREALAVFEAARDEMAGELGADHPDVGRAWHSIGAAHNAVGEGRLALVAYDHALRILSHRLGEDHVDTLKSAFGRGNALLGLGRIEEALASYETCVAALAGDGPPPLLVFCLDSQAKAYNALGRRREAGNVWRRAHGLAQSQPIARLPIRATIPFSLAEIDLAEGNRAGAIALMREAKAVAVDAQWDTTALNAAVDAWLVAHAGPR